MDEDRSHICRQSAASSSDPVLSHSVSERHSLNGCTETQTGNCGFAGLTVNIYCLPHAFTALCWVFSRFPLQRSPHVFTVPRSSTAWWTWLLKWFHLRQDSLIISILKNLYYSWKKKLLYLNFWNQKFRYNSETRSLDTLNNKTHTHPAPTNTHTVFFPH